MRKNKNSRVLAAEIWNGKVIVCSCLSPEDKLGLLYPTKIFECTVPASALAEEIIGFFPTVYAETRRIWLDGNVYEMFRFYEDNPFVDGREIRLEELKKLLAAFKSEVEMMMDLTGTKQHQGLEWDF